jgi:hypothetical protein
MRAAFGDGALVMHFQRIVSRARQAARLAHVAALSAHLRPLARRQPVA